MSRAAAAALLTLLFLLVPVALFGQAAPLCDVTCSPNPGSGDYGSILAARPRLPNARGSMNPRVPMAARGPIPEPPIPTRPTDEAPSLPGSESYNYAIPLLHRPGRAGLDLDLTLYYNSRIWTVDSVNATATFNADNDWPSYGFRLGWGPLEYDASNDQYVVTLPDGSKETLTNNGAGAYVTTDGTLMSFGPAAQNGGNILRLKDGTWLQYIVFPTDSNLLRVQGITDPNGNVIFITYRSDAWAQTAGHGQEIDTIYDTAGNQFVFNYDANHRLSSISQGSKTWATFFWGTTTLTYSFSGLTVTADTQTSGSTINVLLSCTYADGTGYNFGYGGWG
ncbi:MAG TPA: hypothetical protein VE825_14605, partial [Terriglobales bacterium]|nr:hypothetical protein [Terriglobales bacterium]